jgi:4-alpha-glucanotransferase
VLRTNRLRFPPAPDVSGGRSPWRARRPSAARGLLGGRLELRHAIGADAPGADLVSEQRARAAERASLVAALRDDGELPEAEAPVADAELVRAAHTFLARSPARLVALSLDDLAGETEPLNLPGVPVERHRSWSRRMAKPLDEIAAGAEAPRR